MNEQRPIIIVGMARSGTTWLARLLHAQGISMWDWDSTHAEDGDIWGWLSAEMLLNKPDYGMIPFAYIPSKDFLDRLRSYGDRRQEEAPAGWGFKEPRISRMLKAFLEVWPRGRYILCLRNPLSVVWSQRARKGASLTEQQHLRNDTTALANVLACFAGREGDLHVLNYDSDPKVEIAALAEFLKREIRMTGEWKHSMAVRGYTPEGGECPTYEITRDEDGS